MTIQFERKTDLGGETWFFIRVDGTCIKSFMSHQQEAAASYYNQVVKRAKEGGETIEILSEETINP